MYKNSSLIHSSGQFRSSRMIETFSKFPFEWKWAGSGRTLNFTNFTINDQQTDVITVLPGSQIKMNYSVTPSSQVADGDAQYCPGCIIQFYIRINEKLSVCIFNGGLRGNMTMSSRSTPVPIPIMDNTQTPPVRSGRTVPILGGTLDGNNIYFTAPSDEGDYYMQVVLELQYYPHQNLGADTELNNSTLVKIIVQSPPTPTPAPTLAPTTPAPTLAPTTPAPTLAPTTPAPTLAPTTLAAARTSVLIPTTPAPTPTPMVPMPLLDLIFDPIFESDLVLSPLSTTTSISIPTSTPISIQAPVQAPPPVQAQAPIPLSESTSDSGLIAAPRLLMKNAAAQSVITKPKTNAVNSTPITTTKSSNMILYIIIVVIVIGLILFFAMRKK